MTKIKGGLFHKDDKDILDALLNQTPSKKSVQLHLKARGLLLSNKEEKEDFAEYIAPWFTSFFDQKFIIEEKGGGSSRQRFTSSEVILEYNKDTIRDLLVEIKNDTALGLNITIKSNGDSLAVEQSYTKADFTKNVLSQNIPKNAEIEIKKTADNKILIRSNNDDQARKIISVIKNKLKENNSDTYEEFDISFVNIVEAKFRTDFFLKLINDIDGYSTVDMKSVAVSKTDLSSTESSSDADVDETTLGYIKRIMLNGGAVHHSRELNGLLAEDFYITRIEWTMDSDMLRGEKIDLYAEFRDTNNCSDLIYALQKVYTKKDDGTFNITGKPPSSIENIQILPKIEASAKKSFIIVQSEYNQTENLIEPNNENLIEPNNENLIEPNNENLIEPNNENC